MILTPIYKMLFNKGDSREETSAFRRVDSCGLSRTDGFRFKKHRDCADAPPGAATALYEVDGRALCASPTRGDSFPGWLGSMCQFACCGLHELDNASDGWHGC